MRVVVSVGGSVLAPDLGNNRVEAYASVVEGLVESGHDVAAVVGGGGVAREYIGAARELGANEIELDQLGISVTRLNARLLLSALDEAIVAPRIPEDYETAGEALHRGDVAVMGGVVPAQTTDAVAAALAEYVDADLLVYATSVAGVYSADPKEDPDAERYDELTAGALVETIASMEMNAGSSAPVDLLAGKIIQRAGLEAIVLDGSDPERVTRAVEADEFEGTRVVPEAR
ncbi:UMP kinase [Halorarius litoreus]|uniref:UMP kinase n=1 Tax=Halorarius litoreus TaxID=2962676 RepID=UPI0020CF95DA|nr:UMP kinase [Halorarius litoreus]